MNFNRYLFNELIARGEQVWVLFDPDGEGVDVPVHTNTLVFGDGVTSGGLGVWNDCIASTLEFQGVPGYVVIPWKSVLKVGLQSGAEWQVVATPLPFSKGWS